ncbi:hypothetical protein BAU15_07990 [Enterococcus sp. JM4C]|uniref:pectate lyase-like adhesive domain-containing protein n=1 Tax=Candidatus Enterococcus huntleyi TaxID=1857217 RepID=UPI00137A48E7|nr:pectate lyase-like adhesive domain-containing protein [Enterococcus sp. JM4C]KAF1297835.1 hypothetical protein BAU15_07990 [Enterococcus sp. JM4C]
MKKNALNNYLKIVMLVVVALIGGAIIKGIQPLQAKEEPYQLSLVETDAGKALKVKVTDADEQYTLDLKGMQVMGDFAAEEETDSSETTSSEEDVEVVEGFTDFEVKETKDAERVKFTFSEKVSEGLIPVQSDDFSEAEAVLNSGENKVATLKEEKAAEDTKETKATKETSSESSTASESTSETKETEKTEESEVVESQYPLITPTITDHLNKLLDNTKPDTQASIYAQATEGSFIPATAAEIAAANAKHGNFNPNANVKYVSTWAQFYAAYNDQTTTKIVMQGHITDPGTSLSSRLDERQKSIEIDGQGYALYLARGHNLRTNLRPNSFTENGRSRAFFHMHDVVAIQGTNAVGSTSTVSGWIGGSVPEAPGSWSFVTGDGINEDSGQDWYYRFGNIRTVHDPMTARGVARLARAYSGEVTMYGHNDMPTIAENFYAGSVVIEPGTFWLNTCTHYDYSTLWYQHLADAADTGGTKEYTVGENSFVYNRNTSAGYIFPAIYHHYGTMTIGENATFNANMTGNAVRFDDNGSKFVAKKGSTVNLLSRGGASVVNYYASNSSFIGEPGSSIFIAGQVEGTDIPLQVFGQGIIEMNGYLNNMTGNKFLLDSPKIFDIRNRNADKDFRSRAIDISASSGTFEIISSDIDLWKNTSHVMGPSDYTYERVPNMKFTGQTPSSTNSDLLNVLRTIKYNGFRRIAGMNVAPQTEWIPVTDADKTYGVRVLIGYTPADDFDEFGNAVLVPVYASEGQAEVTFVDTYGVKRVVPTDADGYAKVTDTRFNVAGKQITASAKRGPWVQEEIDATTVLDVTPPEPKGIVGNKITNATKQISGIGAEKGAMVRVTIEGGGLLFADYVDEFGMWEYNLPRYLEIGDRVTIYFEDRSTLPADFDQTGLEKTRIKTGNRNPGDTDVKYRDATFKKAITYTVEDVLPNSATINKSVVVEGGATTTQVGDTLIYTLKVKNTKNAIFKTTWKDVKIEDILDEHLEFDATSVETAGITPADTTFTYDEETRKLTIDLGDLVSQAEKTVTFKAKVKRNAVGEIIYNSAKAIGFTPREAGTFVPGFVENPTYQTYEVSTSRAIPNPGGAVYGTLSLVSAPEKIDFDIREINEKATHVTTPTYSNPLVVEDTRAANRQDPWHITVKLTQELTLVDENGDLGTDVLRDAIRFVKGDKTTTLTNQAMPLVGNDYKAPDAEGLYNLSEGWTDTATTDGFELYVPAGKVESVGKYQAVLEWNIENTPLPAAANILPGE